MVGYRWSPYRARTVPPPGPSPYANLTRMRGASAYVPVDYPLFPYDVPGIDFAVGSRVSSYTSPIPDGDANNTRPAGVAYAAWPAAWGTYTSATRRVLLNNISNQTISGIHFGNLYVELSGTSANNTFEDCYLDQRIAPVHLINVTAVFRVGSTTTGTVLRYCDIDGGGDTIGNPPSDDFVVNSAVYGFGPVTVYRCEFSRMHGDCINVVRGPSTIEGNLMHSLSWAPASVLHTDAVAIQYMENSDLIEIVGNYIDMTNVGIGGGGNCFRITGQGTVAALTYPITNVRIWKNLALQDVNTYVFHIEGYGNNPTHAYDYAPPGTFRQYVTGVFAMENWIDLQLGQALYPDRTDDLVFNNNWNATTGAAIGTSVGTHRRFSDSTSNYRFYSNGHLRRTA